MKMFTIRRFGLLLALLLTFGVSRFAFAQSAPVDGAAGAESTPSITSDNTEHARAEQSAEKHGGEHGGHGAEEKPKSPFTPHEGTWVNPIARGIFGLGPVEKIKHGEETTFTNVQYDVYVIAMLSSIGMALLWVLAARRQKLRPTGKPTSLANLFEAMLEGFLNYLNSVMGEELSRKYAPLIASFFFTILTFNMIGLVPGFVKPTTNLNIPIGMALFAFLSVHFIAIKEVGVKNWFMHFVGEPTWLAPLNFPLHFVGELIKPISLAIRLFCNMFGEEMVVVQLGLLSLAAGAALGLPTFFPFQLPMLMLGVFFSFLQALVFATLLAIYISVMGTHHDEHGHEQDTEHDHGHAASAAVPVA